MHRQPDSQWPSDLLNCLIANLVPLDLIPKLVLVFLTINTYYMAATEAF
jgi:hypothetical protein